MSALYMLSLYNDMQLTIEKIMDNLPNFPLVDGSVTQSNIFIGSALQMFGYFQYFKGRLKKSK